VVKAGARGRVATVTGLAVLAGAAARLLGRRGAGRFGSLPGPTPPPFDIGPVHLLGTAADAAPPVLSAAGQDLGLVELRPASGLTRDSEGWELRGEAGEARIVVEGHVPADEDFSWFDQEEGATVLHGRRDGRRCHVRVQLASHDPTLELAAAQRLLDAVLPPHPA
jgi:hypothetical protein